jgi:hypothetical protein
MPESVFGVRTVSVLVSDQCWWWQGPPGQSETKQELVWSADDMTKSYQRGETGIIGTYLLIQQIHHQLRNSLHTLALYRADRHGLHIARPSVLAVARMRLRALGHFSYILLQSLIVGLRVWQIRLCCDNKPRLGRYGCRGQEGKGLQG